MGLDTELRTKGYSGPRINTEQGLRVQGRLREINTKRDSPPHKERVNMVCLSLTIPTRRLNQSKATSVTYLHSRDVTCNNRGLSVADNSYVSEGSK